MPVYHPRPEWAEYVRRLVDQAPPLQPAQVSRLAVLLQMAPPPDDTEKSNTAPAALLQAPPGPGDSPDKPDRAA